MRSSHITHQTHVIDKEKIHIPVRVVPQKVKTFIIGKMLANLL
ncbi:hypothetical protein J31TS6_11290 [Brevibacillus reuszeri]|nr:hypothetical protein J31TS6_11290 [Brevibacillus reuszeri]